jgi:nicotinate-nucleotide adenylyltransferase
VRLGIFGGSFDPPHVGHLLAAIDALEALSLDRLVFVPAAIQPLKEGRASATPEQRLQMVRHLVDADVRFDVDPIEIHRPGLSYTVDTLESFARRFPGGERFFLVGADAMATFSAWREPERIVGLAQLVVLRRPGLTVEAGSVPREAISLPTRLIDVSSTELRERVRSGRSIRGFVPESVARFVETGQLYR